MRGGADAGDAAGAAAAAAGRAEGPGGWVFGVEARVSGPFWPQADSSNPTVRQVTSAARAVARGTKLSDRSDIESILLTMPADAMYTPLTDAEFREKSSAVLAGLEVTLDRWLQDDLIDIDASRTGGLLEMSFPNGSKIVINTQPPLHELWLAARSGGFHFKHVDGRWLDTRSGADFYAVLSRCSSEQGDVSLEFGHA